MCESSDKTSGRQNVEIANIFRMHADEYCKANVLTPEQHKVINAIINCRTSLLGGHVEQCDQCLKTRNAYNSCRNRHCPKCETFKAVKWLESKKAELLPVQYFHVVFTLPHELNNLALYNKKILYNILFKSAWETIKKLGADPKRLNGEMGMLSVLHTWGQNISQHNHVHCIVPGGALKANGQWADAKKYLFPVKVMSKLFRGMFVSDLRAAYEEGVLTLPSKLTSPLPISFTQLLDQLMSKDWVIYAKEPFKNTENLVNYLARYTHKIAISNYRIVSFDENHVSFYWRDYADENKTKVMTLKPHDFIRRFLSHVVPNGFMRIRSFGFLSNASKTKKLRIIQDALDHKPKKVEEKDTATLMWELIGQDITLCPSCKNGKMRMVAEIRSKFNKVIYDTS